MTSVFLIGRSSSFSSSATLHDAAEEPEAISPELLARSSGRAEQHDADDQRVAEDRLPVAATAARSVAPTDLHA